MTMTTLVLYLGFLVLALAGLAIGLWRMTRERGSRPLAQAETAVLPGHSYGPMARLFDSSDLAFLKRQKGYRPGMARRLRLERRAALSLYLRQSRVDFRHSWELYRSLAPHSEEGRFTDATLTQFANFYGLHFALRLQCLLGWLFFVRPDVGGLLAVLQRFQRGERQPASRQSTHWPAATAR